MDFSVIDDQVKLKGCDRYDNGGNECYELLSDYFKFHHQWSFWVKGILILVVGIFGVAGNFLTIVVLRMKTQVS